MKNILLIIFFTLNLIGFDNINGICLGLLKHSDINDELFVNIKKLQIKNLRVSVLWENIEKKKNNYDWSRLDHIVTLANKYKISLTFVVGYTPKWMNRSKIIKNMPSDISQYKIFLITLVKRYPSVHFYEIWNEQNIKNYWVSSPEQYIELLKLSYMTIKKYHSAAKVVHGGIAKEDISYLKWLLENANLYTDAINIHFYYHWKYPKYNKISFIENTIKLAKKYNKSIWITETGVPTGGYSKNNLRVGYFPYEQSEELIKFFLLLKSIDLENRITNVFIYSYGDYKNDSREQNSNFGLVFKNGYKKPSFYSIEFLNFYLSGIKSCNINKLVFGGEVNIECSYKKGYFYYFESISKKDIGKKIFYKKHTANLKFFSIDGFSTSFKEIKNNESIIIRREKK